MKEEWQVDPTWKATKEWCLDLYTDGKLGPQTIYVDKKTHKLQKWNMHKDSGPTWEDLKPIILKYEIKKI